MKKMHLNNQYESKAALIFFLGAVSFLVSFLATGWPEIVFKTLGTVFTAIGLFIAVFMIKKHR